VPAQIQADPSEFEVDMESVPPSVARKLFGGAKSTNQKKTPTATPESVSLPIKVDSTSEAPSARVADIPSPLRRFESATGLSSASHISEAQPEQLHQKVSTHSLTSTKSVPVIPRRNSGTQSWAPPSLQVRTDSGTEKNNTPMVSSVRDRIRQLELGARRN
jgi:hypothetical protein